MKNQMEKFKNKVRKPNFIIYYFLLIILKIFFFIRCNVHVDKKNLKKMKKPFLIVFNHPSKLDFCYTYLPLWRTRINTMVAYYYFCNYKVGELIHLLGGFPKYLFAPDISAIKNTMKVMKNNGAIGISPEGRLSPHGAIESVNPATAKLIKKLKVNVYLNTINGAYLTFPKWSTTIRRGKVEVSYRLLFSKDDIERLTEAQIDQKLNEALYYDDFEWQEKHKIKYHGKKFAEGLEHILYICPVCKQLYTYTSHNDMMECSCCHTKVRLNHYYQFESETKLPDNIRDWYDFQKEYEAANITEEFKLISPVTLKMPDPKGKGFVVVGKGYTQLTKDGMIYDGTINNEKKVITYRIENIEAIVFGVNEDFEIYQDDTLYYFIPDNIKECARYSILTEIFYNQYLKENKQLEK